jgi:phage baseplate assembly protein W
MASIPVTRNPDYKDLDLDFIKHPATKDVVKKTGIDAIKRSIRNLVLTNFYDRPFRPGIGSSAQQILFDNINQFTAIFLRNAIAEVINNFEPRVRLTNGENGVIVTVDPENNGYNATISFVIINTSTPATIRVFLERLR